MADRSLGKLIEQIHATPTRLVLAITGGGSRAISTLLEVPGASRTVLEAGVPYSADALSRYLGARPEKFCSPRTARAMAMAAFWRALASGEFDAAQLAGVAATASLASDRPKRGPHRIHVAMQNASATHGWSLELTKDARTRGEEESLCSKLIITAVARACAVPAGSVLDLLPGEVVHAEQADATPEQTDLLLGKTTRIDAGSGPMPPADVIFAGAFNPLHDGHLAMIEIAETMLGRRVGLEMSIANVDKPPLDFLEIADRLTGLQGHPVWLTRAATFVEKARLFPGAVFVVGGDTIARIADPKYYQDDAHRTQAAIDAIASAGCRFLVFGRLVEGEFRSLSDFDLPESLRLLCREVPAEQFRADISSTELREQDDDGEA